MEGAQRQLVLQMWTCVRKWPTCVVAQVYPTLKVWPDAKAKQPCKSGDVSSPISQDCAPNPKWFTTRPSDVPTMLCCLQLLWQLVRSDSRATCEATRRSQCMQIPGLHVCFADRAQKARSGRTHARAGENPKRSTLGSPKFRKLDHRNLQSGEYTLRPLSTQCAPKLAMRHADRTEHG